MAEMRSASMLGLGILFAVGGLAVGGVAVWNANETRREAKMELEKALEREAAARAAALEEARKQHELATARLELAHKEELVGLKADWAREVREAQAKCFADVNRALRAVNDPTERERMLREQADDLNTQLSRMMTDLLESRDALAQARRKVSELESSLESTSSELSDAQVLVRQLETRVEHQSEALVTLREKSAELSFGLMQRESQSDICDGLRRKRAGECRQEVARVLAIKKAHWLECVDETGQFFRPKEGRGSDFSQVAVAVWLERGDYGWWLDLCDTSLSDTP